MSPAAPLAAMRPGPLALAVVLGAFVVWRWRSTGTENRILLVLAAVGLAVYGSGVVHPPPLEKILRDVGSALGPYTYILVGVLAFLETGAFVGLIAPGETVVIVGGFVAGQGEIDIVVLIGLVWACAFAGDTVSFLLGRRLGRAFLVKHGPRVKITEERLEQVEAFLQRHGGPTILIGRFLGLVRALAPFVAGASRLPLRSFLPYDILAAGIWSTTFCLLGFFFWRSFDKVVEVAKKGALAFGTTVGLVIAAIAAYRYLRVPENRVTAKRWLNVQAERPALRPLAALARPVYRRALLPAWRRAAPAVRFAWDRVTPGQLGLELTTLLAVSAVGGYLFFGLGALVEDREVLRTDTRAFDLAGHLQARWLESAVKLVTHLGALPTSAAAVLVAVIVLAARRRVIECAALASGYVYTVAAVHLAKATFDRPRPSDSLVDTDGASFPSGHAAYSVAYIAIAVALAHAFPKNLYRAGFVVAAVAAAAVVGLSRVYLRAHFLSDVVAGWGMAAAIFAVCGLVGLIVAFVRHNGDA
ncbi:MAG TPA: bifunctional DedA family/phosphatase PAP2 family protein [Solirubrobacteraceae bacterium]|nr:bifunctional DedA family/phosphatase PAP2 family protein [Solirubrobacteraceae bacterium]